MARSPFTVPALGATPVRRLVVPSTTIVVLSCFLIVLGLVGGGLLSLKWQDKSDLLKQPVTRDSSQQVMAATVAKLEAEQSQLKHDLTDARARLDTLQATDAQEKAQLGDITSEIDAEQVRAGLVALEGPGVIASFQDSTAAAIPANEDPANYILHDYNLRDVVNTLWASGAEAISLNGERILSTTSLYCVGSTIICNVTRLSPPYEVHAIGNPDALEAGLRTSPQMQQFNVRAQIYDLPIDIQKATTVAVPAYNGAFTLKYTRPATSGAAPDDTPPVAKP
ncbi:MAG TPA: DUF881 domain-containing protein [Chloroflexia bacterium]|nr:DUF881 domain-containing protein [Chloroflexia bacterium]